MNIKLKETTKRNRNESKRRIRIRIVIPLQLKLEIKLSLLFLQLNILDKYNDGEYMACETNCLEKEKRKIKKKVKSSDSFLKPTKTNR